ncbi:AAA family ATPase [bacterium]|nr:AAA family ATPase [bacterium]
MTEKKIILGFTALLAGGKGIACKYLMEQHGADKFRFSTVLRDMLARVYLPDSRKNMQLLSQLLRENFSQDILSKAVSEDIKVADSKIIVIDGMRRFTDMEHLKNLSGFKLVAIEVDPNVRYERLVKRNENPGDDKKTYEEFLKDEQAEAEIEIPAVMKQADITIDNNGTLEEFYKQLDQLIN